MQSMLRKVPALDEPADAILFTFNMKSLYPSIPINKGLQALERTIPRKFSTPKVELIKSFARLVLTQHYLQFQNDTYRQVRGTAMESNIAIAYACLFVCSLSLAGGIDMHLYKPYVVLQALHQRRLWHLDGTG